jgi:hypothetical protein
MRDSLRPSAYDERWERAFTAIERRFALRFIEPTKALLAIDAQDDGALPEGRGFAILALDCLLIETLFGYRRGGRTRIGETSDAFEDFLREESTVRDDPKLAARIPAFVRAVRNGVLHDGETREGWIVWKGSESGPLAEPLADGRAVLYRDALHANVRRRIEGYFAALRTPIGPEGRDLRAKFKDRIDQLCEASAPPGTIKDEPLPRRWQQEPLPRWSFDQLTSRDERIRHFTPDGLALGMALTEKGSWRYVQGMVANYELGLDVPKEVRRRVEAVRLLHVYGYFQSDFFDFVRGEASLAADLALRARFMKEYPRRATLRNMKTAKTAELAIASYDDLTEALRPRGGHAARDGWRLDGAPAFDGTLRGLYLWARGGGLLRAFLDPIWERARMGIQMMQLVPTEDRGLPKPPVEYANWSGDQRERWWEEAYRPAWEVDYLENEVDLRNAHAHPSGGFNRMPNYSAGSVRQLFDLVNSLFENTWSP